jgi:predicted nucleotidyltransferase
MFTRLSSKSAKMIPAIQDYLQRIEREKNVEILYACESGSRAWGFASPDSDYDIRFLFAKTQADYISIHDGLESIDLPLEQGLLDAGGWDVRKAAKLLGKSNGALLEWLHSPIVYREKPGFRQRWQHAARSVFHPLACVNHYRGLAKQMIFHKLQADAVRAKDYLYALRAALAAQWIMAGHGIPPVAFAELFPIAPAGLMGKIPFLLEYKSRSGEGELMARIPEIDAFLTDFLSTSWEKPEPVSSAEENTRTLNQLLRAEIYRPQYWSAPDFTLERVRAKDMLLFESIAGSHAYGTARPGSDEDRRGVFIAPHDFLLGGSEIPMVSDAKSDHVYYELGRFVDLLLKNNPNALEILAMPDDCVLHAHPLFSLLDPAHYLSKICARTYGEYAMGQIRKARGLKKKIVNPQPKEARTLLDFCHIPHGQGSVPLLEWLTSQGYDAGHCGLTAVAHAPGIYAIYTDDSHHYRGLVSPKNPNAFLFSSVPHGAAPIAWMHCNHDAFSAHCKAHQEYWEWVAQRNEDRYHTNMEHGRGYDSKNLMHTMRLLEMAEDIATQGCLIVRRPNRDALMAIRAGEFSYEDLLVRAEEQLARVEAAFSRSSLPETPDHKAAMRSVLEIRHQFGH